MSAFRKAPLAIMLMLGCAVPAHAGWFSSSDTPAQKADKPAAAKPGADQPAITVDDGVRQAQMLRLAGQYPDAIKHLSQMMMVASDDPRVISEYGKTLAAMGRAKDAVDFLTRAQQMQPTDWTIYSALGVAYDQIGDQNNAKVAYEHALKLKPEEPSVLSNYALSRMLAKDPETARKLAARAETADSSGDAKIVRNIAMIRSLAPEATPPAPVATSQPADARRVVMQHVPADPLAGPVKAPVATAKAAPEIPASATQTASQAVTQTATQAPRALQPKPAMPSDGMPAKPVEVAKPTAIPAIKIAPPPVKAAEIRPASTMVPAPKPASLPVKAAMTSPSVTLRMAPPALGADKPQTPPKVLPPEPMKTADAKPAAKPKDAVPGLRTSANAY